MTEKPRDWDKRYRTGDMPWDSGLPSRELLRVLDEQAIPPGSALELGCGTGTNAVALAERGFHVTAVDLSPTALEFAQKKADANGVSVNWQCGDITDLSFVETPFDFLFDRGCYHCVRKIDLPGFQETVLSACRQGTQLLMITGNSNAPGSGGPPRLSADEIRTDWSEWFDIGFLREIHLEDAGGVEGPLAWSCLMTRNAAPKRSQ
ncbi:class I SAM-dependent methyltransferase [Thalassoroseus pseudoceratinae]|uniref:class I SAM-dependent methyltransferase n=1 Tax=Thalassoroseus pseudoceratinae TaxID=2713176 RepID=UPI0021BC4CA5|nr:class I SAM-dependent methyltransferase [Thalassoroseus pseudoceratinae]